MSERLATELGPKQPPVPPPTASQASAPGRSRHWEGPTYYGRPQVKAAPFNNWVVGGYIFLGGLAGAAALLAAVADRARGPEAAPTVRRGRALSMLAPTLGAGLLIYDLHTPRRFYNMLRVAKPTSPMSIGTWILMSFSGFSILGAAAAAASRWLPRLSFLRRTAKAAQLPAAVTGAGMTTYTAALLSATSTPLWAAAPRSMAVRFGSSSLAAGAAALSMGDTGRVGRTLDKVALLALAADLAATCVSHNTYRRTGVAPALEGDWGKVEKLGVTGLGTLLPMGLYAASLARGRSPALSTLAGIATLAGSAMLRVSTMAAGDESANRPDVSFRFNQPQNLPKRPSRWFRR
ncbi:polysulfide reductase NrfD [Roseomonas sp. M0104]|uniref:Polysulfide reductase NrfD n=1 Tax=Teichococcus coralli TaxID=2545983 RepID=A0A845BJJ4_9PROT|nr:NrfD/PsrC family molybdoenzyme membrane anchor subunit [Pseudoroseomonas coralli]MXP65467.1 polysulfide reductase NrfD [Pseudoroseomonas coralli]